MTPTWASKMGGKLRAVPGGHVPVGEGCMAGATAAPVESTQAGFKIPLRRPGMTPTRFVGMSCIARELVTTKRMSSWVGAGGGASGVDWSAALFASVEGASALFASVERASALFASVERASAPESWLSRPESGCAKTSCPASVGDVGALLPHAMLALSAIAATLTRRMEK
jgi:hypothetical protein